MGYCRKRPDAVAKIFGGVEALQLSGCVRFYQENGCVLIEARISGLQGKAKQESLGSIFIKEKAAPGMTFPKREAIIIQPVKHIRNMQATCHRCWPAKETHICP